MNLKQQISDEQLAVLIDDGSIFWVPRAKFTIRVNKTSPSWFSKSSYDAMFKFASWTYDGFKLDFDFYDKLEKFDLTDFTESSKYRITENSAKKNVQHYPCCSEPYPDLTFKLRFEEKM